MESLIMPKPSLSVDYWFDSPRDTHCFRCTAGTFVYPDNMSYAEALRQFELDVADKESYVKPELPPTQNNNPAVWDLVVNDMLERDKEGRRKYGTPLQPHNGRDVLVDAYQEALDLAVYLRQAIYERDGK